MTIANPEIRTQVEELVARTEGLIPELNRIGVETDATGKDPDEAMDLLWKNGIFNLNVPARFGGLSDGTFFFATEAFMKVCVAIGRGDGNVAQNHHVSAFVIRELFQSSLPDSTKAQIAEQVRSGQVRFVASNAEAGSPRPVTARPVDGGVILSGTKTFNSNSGSGGLASVGCTLDGVEGRHHVVVPLDHPNVVMHDNWDNMGLRGTHSQTIDYNDVFVADDWHWHEGDQDPLTSAWIMMGHSPIMLGPGYGALDAALSYLREGNRPFLPQFSTADEDPLILSRIGTFVSLLEAARAALLDVARQIEAAAETPEAADHDAIWVAVQAAKVACVESAITVSDGIIDLTRARSTATKHRIDRFWRNIRTFSTHDPTDALKYWVGRYYLTGKGRPSMKIR
ncbi:acyl-CoA dehydrogenase family protein [Amycolatopsis sp. NPDC051372]|uniref:acyl-CoA dehydrogenase family protein n=1 Tax=Amycolatopsis sp. NPDC051372 TaxID=3155669 RepID=UPI00343D224A